MKTTAQGGEGHGSSGKWHVGPEREWTYGASDVCRVRQAGKGATFSWNQEDASGAARSISQEAVQTKEAS